MQSILQQDTQRILNDWGVPATLEEVSQYYDPETGQLEESESTTDITVLVGSQISTSVETTQANLHRQHITFLVKSEDLTDDIVLASARIQHQNLRYRIHQITSSQLPGLVALECINETATPPGDPNAA